jgi:hypothetical protein
VQSLGIYSALCVPVVGVAACWAPSTWHTANSDHTLAEDDVSSIESLALHTGLVSGKAEPDGTQKR